MFKTPFLTVSRHLALSLGGLGGKIRKRASPLGSTADRNIKITRAIRR
jgi:hypothetical protein